MKKIMLLLMVISITMTLSAADKVVYSENFENATVGKTTLGNADAMNYGAGAAWTFGIETNYPISGAKSGYFNVTNPGTEWWALQYRIDSKFPVTQGIQYKITFKIQSSVANNIMFKVQDTQDFTKNLSLKGGYDIEEYSIVIPPMDRTANTANFMFAFGAPAVPAEIWIDDIVIEELQSTTGINENLYENVKIWSEGQNLNIDSPESCSVKVFNMIGQTIYSSSIKENGKLVVDVPKNSHFVLVKLSSVDKSSKVVKVKMN